MKLTIDSAPLKQALSRAAGTLATRTTAPILETVLLKADADQLTVEATDMEITIVETLPCKVNLPGGVCVGGKQLNDLISNFPEAPIDFELDGKLRMKSGTYKAALPTLDTRDFPLLRASNLLCRFAFDAATLKGIFKKIEFAQGSDTTRDYLNGVHMHVTSDPESLLVFEATNGLLLAMIHEDVPDGCKHLPPMILPMRSVQQIAKIIADVEGDISLGCSETLVEMKVGALTFVTKLISGTFPDCQRLVPKGHHTRLRLMRAPLAEALSVVAALQGKAAKFIAGAEEVVISGTEQEQGEVSGTLPQGAMELDGPAITFGIWLKSMRNIVNATTGDVELLMTDPLGPLMLKHCDDPSVLYVTMPYRV